MQQQMQEENTNLYNTIIEKFSEGRRNDVKCCDDPHGQFNDEKYLNIGCIKKQLISCIVNRCT